jgi:hypothetical protein
MRVLRDPLLHFVILGAALFVVYALATGLFSSSDVRRIEIGTPEIEFLASSFERQWGRPPTPEELQGLVESRVREEVLYREALAVGLDRNDVVVRRRMVQKMELLTQDLALLADPTEDELRKFFEEHREDYRIPPRLSFSHVYFNVDRRGAQAEDDARRVLAELRAEAPPPHRAPERGDSTMIEYDFALVSPGEVRRDFGNRFADALFELEPGWQGPVVSGYGLHLVNVGERVEGRILEFEEFRDRLVQDYNRVRRDRASEALYESLAGRYEVVIDGEIVPGFPNVGAAASDDSGS